MPFPFPADDASLSALRPFFLADVFPASALERAEIAAASELPIFIFGEPGVGKETLARRIAASSERAGAPFVKIRCDRLPSRRVGTLFSTRSNGTASTFYANSANGEVSAFYADSANDADSAVALADDWAAEVGDGVLYWAEVDALSARAQRRLAALLSSNAAPFRSILGSSRPFADALRDDAFVPELATILTAFPIFLPSLAARRDDWATLVPPFLRDAARRLGVFPLVPTERDLNVVAKIKFRENFRDLRRYCEIATLDAAFPKTLPDAADERQTGQNAQIEQNEQNSTANQRAETDAPPPTRENFPTLDAAAKAHVVAALRLTGGIVEGPSGAAALLAINPHTLRARMRKLGLDWAKIRDESR